MSTEPEAGNGDDHPVGLVEAAKAVLQARAEGPDVAVVARAGAAGAARRLLVFGDGTDRGTLGDDRLDAAARDIGAKLLASPEDSAWTLETPDGSATLYVESHRRAGRLIVVGAGHIGLALTRLGDLLGMPVLALDDREDFVDHDRFPDGVQVERLDFDGPFDRVDIGPLDAVVLVTRAHKYDFDCLRALLDADAAPRYIGMVGSRRRVRAAFRGLLDAGYEADRLARIHAPIGVEIGAETPEEIALSIAAELVAVRRGVEAGGSLRDRERVVERFLAEGEGEEADGRE